MIRTDAGFDSLLLHVETLTDVPLKCIQGLKLTGHWYLTKQLHFLNSSSLNVTNVCPAACTHHWGARLLNQCIQMISFPKCRFSRRRPSDPENESQKKEKRSRLASAENICQVFHTPSCSHKRGSIWLSNIRRFNKLRRRSFATEIIHHEEDQHIESYFMNIFTQRFSSQNCTGFLTASVLLQTTQCVLMSSRAILVFPLAW